MEPYAFPLLIKQLLVTPVAQRSRKEIVYRDRVRYGYPELIARIGRLGSALHRMGVGQGSTVAVLDWDSHRYLECYFAIPMLGAILQTVNVRLAPAAIGLQAAARFRCAVGRRTPSYRRHCRDRCRRRGSDRRSVEGRHQDGRRMGVVAGTGKHRLPASSRQ